MKEKKSLQYIVFTIIIAGALYRILPHLPNFAPITAIALFSGAYLKNRKLSMALPLVILYISDLVLNNTILRTWYPDVDGIVWYSPYMLFGFAAFIIINILGNFFLSKKDSMGRIAASTLSASILFFLISNFGAWIISPIYSKGIAGLGQSYVAGIPFYQGTLMGDVFFVFIFFGTYKAIKYFMTKSLNMA